jgi:hypothetical protein
VKAFCIKAQNEANLGSSRSRKGDAPAKPFRQEASAEIPTAAQNLGTSRFLIHCCCK